MSEVRRCILTLLLLIFSVCLGCSNRPPQSGGSNNRHWFLMVIEAESWGSRHWQILGLRRTHFLVHTWPLLCLHRWREVCGVSFVRALIPSWGSTLMTSSPPKVPPPHALMVRIQQTYGKYMFSPQQLFCMRLFLNCALPLTPQWIPA